MTKIFSGSETIRIKYFVISTNCTSNIYIQFYICLERNQYNRDNQISLQC